MAAVLLAGALDWAAYSPLDVPLEIEARQGQEAVARVYAARGEYEGFRLSVSAGKKGASGVVVEADVPGKDLPAPVIFRLFPVTGAGITGECLDALLPAAPVDLAPGGTAHYWVRYAVPQGAKPGVRQSELHLAAAGERAVKVPVRVEIFDVELPAKAALPSVFYLDRRAIGVPGDDLAGWQAVYAGLAGYRLGLSIWDGASMPLKSQATLLAEHLAAAAEATAAPVLDLAGGNGAGWRGFSPPEPGQTLDPLVIELHQLATRPALAPVGLVAAFDYFGEREAWAQGIAQLSRLPAGGRIERVGVAPLHPAFEKALDGWALPFRACSPAILQRLRGGGGLSGPRGLPGARFTASSLDMNPLGTPYTTRAEDAADGSPFTAWWPVPPKNAEDALWWQADFDEPVLLDEIELQWVPGHAAKRVSLLTSKDGAHFAPAHVDWSERAPATPFDAPATLGKLRFPGEEAAFRLVISVSSGDEVPALAELGVAAHPREAEDISARPIAPWLAVELDTFPSTVPGRHAVEPRILPWVCWFGGLDGIVGASLNAWPKGIEGLDLPREGGDFLFYPGASAGRLAPSLRLERLRDGLEDFEYLRLLADARRAGKRLPEGAEELLQPPMLPPNPTADELTAWAKHILETRVRMGRALSGLR